METKREIKDLYHEIIKNATQSLIHILDRNQYIAVTIYAAELVLPVFEKYDQKNKQPHLSIAAAEVFLRDPSLENKAMVEDNGKIGTKLAYTIAEQGNNAASDAAYIAAHAATASSPQIAFNIVDVAAITMSADAYATYSSISEEIGETESISARNETYRKILKFGIKLI